MKNKTAVQWLFLMLNNPNSDQDFANKLLEKALEIEKEQIIDAIFFGIHLEYNNIDSPLMRTEQYYNETFSNTSD